MKRKAILAPDRAIIAELKALDKAEAKIIRDDNRASLAWDRAIRTLLRQAETQDKAITKALATIARRRATLQARLSAS